MNIFSTGEGCNPTGVLLFVVVAVLSPLLFIVFGDGVMLAAGSGRGPEDRCYYTVLLLQRADFH